MHGNMKSTPKKLFSSREGYITPTQRAFFTRVINIIRAQTEWIEKTDSMLKSSLTDEQKAAVKALDTIPGIGEISAEQIVA